MPHKKTKSVRPAIDAIRRTPARELPAHEKRAKVTEEIIRDLKGKGAFFKSSLGLFYFEKSQPPSLYRLDADSITVSAMLDDRYGINKAERQEFEHLMAGLRHEAHLRGRSVNVRRLAHYDCQTARLYVSRFDGWVCRLNGQSIRGVPNGTDGVFFWDDPSWQPYEVLRGKLRSKSRDRVLTRLIFESVNFSDDAALNPNDQQWLFSVWLRSHFFGSLLPTKPLLLICGEKGSGKTLAMRKWLKLLFGPAGEVTSLERDKQDGFVAAVCAEPVVAFDNVDEHVGWLADLLAQIATGISFKRRQLYTTNQQVEFKPQCFVALNSRTPKFLSGRDDVLDRSIILQAQRLTDFDGEDALLDEIARYRNSLWTELLRGFNKLLAVTPPNLFRAHGAHFRMADFAGFAIAVARAEGAESKATRVLTSLESRRTEMLLGNEPIFLCLEKWLEEIGNRGRQVSSGDLQKELAAIAGGKDAGWTYPSGHSLGQRLAHISSNLAEHFRVETVKDTSNQLDVDRVETEGFGRVRFRDSECG